MKDTANNTVPTRIKDRREALDLTQTQLAERMGVGQSVVADLERGRWSPRVSTLERVAKALKCTVRELV